MQENKTQLGAGDGSLEIASVYANNSQLELSVWDLKIIFGQLDQHVNPARIDWHTAVTMPWMQAKLLAYHLRLNLAFHEKFKGVIQVDKSVIPPPPEPPSGEAANDPTTHAVYELFKKIYAETFADS